MDIPVFDTKKELFAFLIKNKEVLIAQKKAQIKHSDAIVCNAEIIKTSTQKAEDSNYTELQVKVIINTTNIIDSHKDCHMPGIWAKSLNENKMLMHIQEHKMEFDKIISDGKDLKAYTKTFGWMELGFNYPGTTEALVFESTIKKDRNEFMFDQYKKGYVKNHSVAMQYIKMLMCINDEDYGAEYEAWQKYYPEIANKEKADEDGYFWIVKEAKIIEGSAVPRGSNITTPVLSIEGKSQPLDGTGNEPLKDTLKGIDYEYLTNKFKNLKTF